MGFVGGAVITWWAISAVPPGEPPAARRRVVAEARVARPRAPRGDRRRAGRRPTCLGARPGRRSCIVSIVTAQPRELDVYRDAVLGALDVAHLTIEIHRCALPQRSARLRTRTSTDHDRLHGADVAHRSDVARLRGSARGATLLRVVSAGLMKHAIAFAWRCRRRVVTRARVWPDRDSADTVCGIGPTVKGIDVSYYQGTIDWTAVEGDGVEFAFIRVSDGLDYPDPKFAANWADSRTRRRPPRRVSVLPARPGSDRAGRHAARRRSGPMQADDLPPVIDVEVTDGLAPPRSSAAVKTWVEHVQAAIGRAPIVYTGKYFWRRQRRREHVELAAVARAVHERVVPGHRVDRGRLGVLAVLRRPARRRHPAGGVDVDRWNGDSASFHAFLGPAGPCGVHRRDRRHRSTTATRASRPAARATGHAPRRPARAWAASLVWTHTTGGRERAELRRSGTSIRRSPARTRSRSTRPRRTRSRSRPTTSCRRAARRRRTRSIRPRPTAGRRSATSTFAAGGNQSVHLGDNTGEPESTNTQLVFDAVRITPVSDPGSGEMSGSDVGDPSGGGGDGGGGMMGAGGCSVGGGAGGASWLCLLGIGLVLLRRPARSRK